MLEAGYSIAVGEVEERGIGIDTPEDYRRFVARWRTGQGIGSQVSRNGC